MNIGTRSVLYGYHSFWLHWFFVARGWYQLHGFQPVTIGHRTALRQLEQGPIVKLRLAVKTSLWDFRLWVAFFLHDLGYWGLPNMDGPEGELHPEWAAQKMARWFGEPWGDFCKYHSRFLARRDKRDPSMLCAPDKMAIALYPRWLFLALVRATGEIAEYMKQNKSGHSTLRAAQEQWADDVQDFTRKYATEMKHGGKDTITGGSTELNVNRTTATDSGVYQ